MANGLNKVILIGRVEALPEMRYTPAGVPVSLLRIKAPRPWPSERKPDRQVWETFQVVIWEALAERAFHDVEVGDLVYVEGYFQTRNWLDDQRAHQARTELVATDIKTFSPDIDKLS